MKKTMKKWIWRSYKEHFPRLQLKFLMPRQLLVNHIRRLPQRVQLWAQQELLMWKHQVWCLDIKKTLYKLYCFSFFLLVLELVLLQSINLAKVSVMQLDCLLVWFRALILLSCMHYPIIFYRKQEISVTSDFKEVQERDKRSLIRPRKLQSLKKKKNWKDLLHRFQGNPQSFYFLNSRVISGTCSNALYRREWEVHLEIQVSPIMKMNMLKSQVLLSSFQMSAMLRVLIRCRGDWRGSNFAEKNQISRSSPPWLQESPTLACKKRRGLLEMNEYFFWIQQKESFHIYIYLFFFPDYATLYLGSAVKVRSI